MISFNNNLFIQNTHRFASYTQPLKSHHETIPLLTTGAGEKSTTALPMKTMNNKTLTTQTTTKLGMSAKISPMNNKSPINKLNMATGGMGSSGINSGGGGNSTGNRIGNSQRVIPANSNSATSTGKQQDEKADNKKNEIMEKKKKDDKMKIKAEKDARKVVLLK